MMFTDTKKIDQTFIDEWEKERYNQTSTDEWEKLNVYRYQRRGDQTSTDEWEYGKRMIRTSKDEVYRHPKNDQTFTDDWG